MTKKLEIDTIRLTIRNLTAADLPDFHFYRSNPEVTKYQGFDVMTLAGAEAFIEGQKDKQFGTAGEWVQYAIESKNTGRLVGDCAIKLDEHDTRMAEIGITISHTEQNKGYGKETLRGILDFLFAQDGFHRVTEIVDAENEASIALLQAVGFRREGHFIENIFFKGKWGSEYQYALLRREWESFQFQDRIGPQKFN
jgi:RimJ/RimL family protein N-acetyltransferase